MITTIFYYADEFCKYYEKEVCPRLLPTKKKKRNRKSKLSLSEIITIAVYFHFSGYKTFKAYYERCVCGELRDCFPSLVSYNRFLELRKKYQFPIVLFAMLISTAECTGISFIDSFPIKVCHNKRIYSHKTFKGIAKRGASSMGWFFGFKLHIVINHRGEVLSFCLAPGNVHDANQSLIKKLIKKLWGKLFGDKGYVGEPLFKMLWNKGVEFITAVRKNMKRKALNPEDKALLGRRGVIESVGNILKNTLSIEHTRHRSLSGFLTHVCSALIAYAFKERKPSIKMPAKSLSQNSMLSLQ